MEPLILHIESSTKTCSICLSKGESILGFRDRTEEKYSHAETLTPFIQEICKEAKVKLSSVDGVAVSMGPGSYTGLRIGTSTAKGICYAARAKLIAIPSLAVLAQGVVEKAGEGDLIIPMIDARRDEVYTAIFDHNLNVLEETSALVLDENSFTSYKNQKILLAGDGAKKGKKLLMEHAGFPSENLVVAGTHPTSRSMVPLALSKWNKEDFEDVAYFEPFYLKAFVAGKPRKLL